MKGGNAIDYELKYMFILLTSILKQKPIQIVKKQIDWQKMLRYAEYHNVITLYYYAILGLEKEFTGKMEQELYQKYKRELLLQSEYHIAQEAIIWQLEKHHIRAILLSGIERYELYDKKELGHIDNLEFFVGTGNLRKIKSLMYEMDYEQKQEQEYQGVLYVRAPGIKVRFLYEFQNVDRHTRKVLTHQNKEKSYVRKLTPDKQYIYFQVVLMEQYLLGEITIRHILDFYLYREKFDSMISKEVVEEMLRKAGLQELEHCLTILGQLWFDNRGAMEESTTAFALEEYILNPGKIDLSLDQKLLLSGRKRPDFYKRDREEEWRLKKRGWLFPPKDYMKQFFPILNKVPFLIIFCWGIRSIRILKKIIEQYVVELRRSILERIKRKKSVKGAKENEENEVR